MPFKRRYRKPRRKLATVATVKKMIAFNHEKKYNNNTRNSLGVDNAGTIDAICQPSQGSSDTTRDGDAIVVKSIDLRFNVIGGDATNFTRFILFQWKPDTSPIVGDILLSSAGLANVSPYNHDNKQMFKILYDTSVATTLNGPNAVTRRKLVFKGFNKKLQWQGGGAVGTNLIYLLMISDSAAASHPQVTYTCYSTYTDA